MAKVSQHVCKLFEGRDCCLSTAYSAHWASVGGSHCMKSSGFVENTSLACGDSSGEGSRPSPPPLPVLYFLNFLWY